jgi:ACS family tartrate transporter-like MFS transporter
MDQIVAVPGAVLRGSDVVERETIKLVSLRLIPFLGLAYLLAYINRVNIGFAALEMNADLEFGPVVYSWGAGIFFIAYFLFEVPSNIALEKFGARRWIARIMVTWGVISAAMALVQGTTSFYVLRFLLGAAEAGFFPGIILYLTYWFPTAYRGRILAAFIVAVPISTVIGAPLSGFILTMDGLLGLRGWQWVFIVEGVPAVLMGIFTWFYMTDRPETASWLPQEQRNWLVNECNRDRSDNIVAHMTLWEALKSSKVLLSSLAYFSFVAALYGMQFWLPQIIRQFGLSNVQTGFVTAIPYFVASIAMVLWSRNSDRTRERVWHTAIPLLAIAVSLAACAYLTSPEWTMVALTIAACGVFCTFAVIWTLPTNLLAASAAAGGIAMINSIGNLAGFAGPYIIGFVKESTGSATNGLVVLSVFPFFGALIVLYLGQRFRAELKR